MIPELALDIIKKYEGFRKEAYKCPAGVWTIGYGHTSGVRAGDRCTGEQAERWLSLDVLDAERAVDYLVKVPLSETQRGALVSLVFNVGTNIPTLLNKLNILDYKGAAEAFGLYVKAGGKVLSGLVSRRREESDLFRLGTVYEDGPPIHYSRKALEGSAFALTKRVQRLLKDEGYYLGLVDGIPGEGTSAAVRGLFGFYLMGDGRSAMD